MSKEEYLNNGIGKEHLTAENAHKHPATSAEDVRSEEMSEIIGKMPHWIIRRGIAVIAILFMTVLLGTYFFKYPDSIPAKVVISPGNVLVNVAAPDNLILQTIIVANDQEVTKGQVLGAYSNRAIYEDVAKITSFINLMDTSFDLKNTILNTAIPPHLQLGELQPDYATLYRSLEAYKVAVSVIPDNQGIHAKKSNIISVQEFRNEHDLQREIKDAVNQFKNQYTKWEQNYIIKSPADGKVSFAHSWKRNQSVLKDESIMLIKPPLHDIILTGKVNPDYYRKIRTGQKVLLNLNAYPSEEYGTLEARISKHNWIAHDTTALIELKLTHGLTTSQGKTIPSGITLSADAEIITDHKTVLSRLFDSMLKPLKY